MNEEEAITYFHQILEKRGIKIDYSNWRNWLVVKLPRLVEAVDF